MVIDELIVVLGLDARKFTEGQRDAVAAFKKGKEGAVDFGKSVEESNAKVASSLSVVQKGILGVVAGIAGGGAIQFVERIVQMDAATGRFAKTIGTSVTNLSTWQYMVKQIGGDAAAATSTLSSLQQELENARQGGGMLEGGFASLLGQAGGSLSDNADTILRKIQKYLAGQISSGNLKPEQAATFLRRVPGMNQDVLNLMLDDFDRIEKAAHKSAVADEASAAAAQKAQEKSATLTQGLERWGLSLIDLLGKKPGEVTAEDFKKLNPWRSDASTPASDGGGTAGGGGTRGDRNNNPGNMEYGAFARAHGATGSDGRFAVFPDWATGAAAQQSLVSGKSYSGLTLHEFASRYAEGAPAWERTVGGALGLGPNDIVNNQDPRLVEAIRRAEGTGARGSAASRSSAGVNRTSSSSSEVNIGSMHINAPNAKDADGIAGEVGGALKRQSMIAPANNALV